MSLNVKRTLLKAKSLAKQGDKHAAAALYNAILDKFPANRQAAQGLASLQRAQPASTQASKQAFIENMQSLVSLFNEGHLQQALSAGQALARQYPDEPLIHNVLGAANKSLRHYDAAIASLTEAIRLKPDYAEAYSNLGAAFHDIGMYEEAVTHYRKAARYDPYFFEAYNNLGNVLMDSNRPKEAVSSYQKALELRPDSAETLSNMLFQLAQICDWNTIESLASRIPALGVSGDKVHPFALLHSEDNPARHRLRSELYVRQKFQRHEPSSFIRPEVKPSRLRIGYFSADFHNHATMYLMAKLFECHDRSRYVIHAYSYGMGSDDGMRNRLQEAVDEFHDVRSLSDSDIAGLARSHDIDIAVDLKGHTQHARMGIFSYRAAPVQVSYLGYPGTTGASFIDYLVADPLVLPPESKDHYCEEIIFLPHSYQVNDDTRQISGTVPSRKDEGLPEQGLVFCCFNNNFKIGPREFDIWMRLLRQVEDSVLWLLRSNTEAEDNLREQAQIRGIDPDRIVFADRREHSEHLARHQLADLFLDTFNYNAHTTASDALWAGLPVITLAGQGFAARVATSLLGAIDLRELITRSASEYEQLALALALDPARLTSLKSKLARNRLTTPLFDTGLFARHIENAYEQAYQKYFDNTAPDTIVVTTWHMAIVAGSATIGSHNEGQ